MSVLDSSGWIEFFVGGPNANAFEEVLEQSEGLVVPTIVLVEVRRWALSHGKVNDVDELTAVMARHQVVALTPVLAVSASDLGIRHRLPLADSIVYATAQSLGLDVWTQDGDFEGLPGAHYVPRAQV
ncbi:MAG: type II toxin-antitoxin system VapC family toxin [bacterium]